MGGKGEGDRLGMECDVLILQPGGGGGAGTGNGVHLREGWGEGGGGQTGNGV